MILFWFMQASLGNDTSCESVVTTPEHPLGDKNNLVGLLSIAEEPLMEFLSKATGTAVEWIQMPRMKPGPDSIGIVAISHSCSGVAARACGLVNLEPMKASTSVNVNDDQNVESNSTNYADDDV